MSPSQLAADIAAFVPRLRGRLTADAPLAPYTWFRVGGAADVLLSPADEDDLGYVLAALPHEIPVTTVGVGSNLIVRDGGVRGVAVSAAGRSARSRRRPTCGSSPAPRRSMRRWRAPPPKPASMDWRSFAACLAQSAARCV
jgi:hypothetical protein